MATVPTPPPILVVDDELRIRDTLSEYLNQEGFEVEVCASGEEAYSLAILLCEQALRERGYVL